MKVCPSGKTTKFVESVSTSTLKVICSPILMDVESMDEEISCEKVRDENKTKNMENRLHDLIRLELKYVLTLV
ncbi:MAG: hypothetical protein CMP05_03060 [Xanthomarina sp.]|jgi:hypothetical protein|uniref:Uncharacterized protein n=1 Tax=Xanthomarina gelatinilytica TaxID=1137281 RepID=M7ML86_9FLAO|nr:hypothetical protein D778_01721 [Xanthomarina gelatinilytica]MAL22371.1 hypothetical protein [Xanthomarina sp.]MBF60958.1 hypothetical protein [Xanthomarina sp.]HAB28801.1 hypothetical protein [Xanthomarina gelatinilytica]HAI18944.1 hypothetical protein [Xanthomarina gelatinilytica]|tara:strand:+ start:252 stop:470 length:219 start_codon:yes stop_codon:yes gene_type:complete